ncbi:hypothetical protein [Pedobacter sp. SL55]|uniref:hypothetical protein n=1 Tax=Pedobacter sp. SL55 TaxID=2995161 RepID=UPI00226E79E4|nr:hypothetical protein [Pedobacter sp. SL55]WAC39239.1 hypothetical protein OVA16_11525 [Pedobacter sp. SL55]
MKYWEILLIKQQERGKDGLTIPFLIGSQKYFSSEVSYNINSLIQEMAISKTFETCIRYCMGTQTLIAEVRKEKNAVYYVKDNQEVTNISIGVMSKGDLGLELDQVIENLIDKFLIPIKDNQFSAEPNVNGRCVKWNKFSTQDIQFIRDSFNTF